jgi:hypothetical protein
MIDPSRKKRIDSAWSSASEWITDFDGSPTVTLLVNIPPDALLPGLIALAAQAEDFRVTSIPIDRPSAAEFVPLDSLPEQINHLREGKLAELSANYTAHLEKIDLDARLLIYPVGDGKSALELDWWGDQVFLDDTDPASQFAVVAVYFLDLQALFQAPQVFLTPESGKDPESGSTDWVEI